MDAVRLKCCVSSPPRVGFDRMKTFVDKLEYGNRDIGGAPIGRPKARILRQRCFRRTQSFIERLQATLHF
jgi:hypothetical protein